MVVMQSRIVLGVTGGIAAYKSAYLLRLLVRQGFQVRVVMTPAATEFITPLTLSTLSGNPVRVDSFERSSGEWHSHVALAEWGDVLVIAPATANTLGKMAQGIADNLLLTTYLSFRKEVVVAPAMDLVMYQQPAMQANLELLRERGVRIVDSAEGYLASGLHGKGRMAEPELINAEVVSALGVGGQLEGKQVLVTMGGTREALDPVRYLSNGSSGYMGRAVVEALSAYGARVHCVLTPSRYEPLPSSSVILHRVMSAQEMLTCCESLWSDMDGGVMVAAVADYRPAEQHAVKMRREECTAFNLSLQANPDIAATLGKSKRKGQWLVGFALETDGGLERAQEKMERKGFNLCVYNEQRAGVSGIGTKGNRATLLYAHGGKQVRPQEGKEQLARGIVEAIVEGVLDEC